MQLEELGLDEVQAGRGGVDPQVLATGDDDVDDDYDDDTTDDNDDQSCIK